MANNQTTLVIVEYLKDIAEFNLWSLLSNDDDSDERVNNAGAYQLSKLRQAKCLKLSKILIIQSSTK